MAEVVDAPVPVFDALAAVVDELAPVVPGVDAAVDDAAAAPAAAGGCFVDAAGGGTAGRLVAGTLGEPRTLCVSPMDGRMGAGDGGLTTGGLLLRG